MKHEVIALPIFALENIHVFFIDKVLEDMKGMVVVGCMSCERTSGWKE
jgi:hypothetical protein